MVRDQEAVASLVIDDEFGVGLKEILDRKERPRPGGPEVVEGINDTVLDEAIAPGRHERRVHLKLLTHVGLGVIAVQNHHHGPCHRGGFPVDPLENEV